MVKKKACKNCKIFADDSVCPICKNAVFSTSWQGRLQILDVENSEIAKKVNHPINGEYAIKVR